MALATNIRTQSAMPQDWSFERILNGLLGMFKTDPRRAIYRQTVRELESLSARDLNDMGIHRSTIETVAREAAYGK